MTLATKAALWRERSTKRVLDIQAGMDLALFSLGSPLAEVPSHVYAGGYLSDPEFNALEESGIVGDVATVFYRGDGTWSDISLNARSSGPDLGLIRKTARRLCVVSGKSKLASLQGALAAKIITDLIVDESTGRALVEAAQR